MDSLKATGSLGNVWRHAVGAVAFLLCCGIAQATVIFTGSATLSAGDPTQLGRLSRNGVAQDWTGGEPFPGVVNATTSYHYTTIDIDVSALEAGYVFGGFLQIEFFNGVAPFLFLGAYAGSYNPADLSQNWLGDGGTSPPIFGANSTFFQLVAAPGDHIILVMNETTPGAGLGLLGEITIEAFSDTAFTDLVRSTAPEPGTLPVLFLGLAVLMAARRSSARAARSPRS
jgi:hypothetical protein